MESMVIENFPETRNCWHLPHLCAKCISVDTFTPRASNKLKKTMLSEICFELE